MLAAAEDEYVQKLKDAGVKIISYDEIDIESFKAAVRPLNEAMPMFNEISDIVEKIIASH